MINRNQAYNQGSNNRRIQSSKNPQISQVSKTTNNQNPSNSQFNNKAIFNNNQNQIKNSNMNMNRNNHYDIVGKAFLLIRGELKKKDDRILQLEKKVEELTKKLNFLTNRNNYNISSQTTPFRNVTQKEYKEVQNRNITNKIGSDLPPDGYNLGYGNMNIGDVNQRSYSYTRSISHNIPNYNSDSENIVKRFQRFDNLSHSHENSAKSYNGSYYNSKIEVKNYLRTVKNILDPKKFKEFIKNIKLLTVKNNSTFNRNIIVENVRIIFGEEHKDLFLRFKTIIGR